MPRVHPLVPKLACLAWGALILWLSLDPSPPQVEYEVLAWDKFQHTCAYAFLALLAGWALGGRRGPNRPWILAFFFALLFGALVEVAQGFLTVERSAEWADLGANAAGAAGACLAGRFRPGRRSGSRE